MRGKRKSRSMSLLGIALCNIFFTLIVTANDSFWKSAGVGSFSDPANWLGGVPGASDSARFTNSSNQQLNWTANVINANAYFNAASGVLTQTIGGFRWTVTNEYVLGVSLGFSSTVNHVSGTLVVTNAARTAQMVLGVDGVGDFRLEGGSVIVDRLICTNRLRSTLEFPQGHLITLAGGLLDIPYSSEGGNAELRLGTTSGALFRWDISGGTLTVDNSLAGVYSLTTLGFATGVILSG